MLPERKKNALPMGEEKISFFQKNASLSKKEKFPKSKYQSNKVLSQENRKIPKGFSKVARAERRKLKKQKAI